MKQDISKQINWLLKEKYDGKMTARAKKDIERLKAGEPLDYVIGFTEFLGCKIDLSKKPLIPRVETEFWVEKSINNILTFSRMSEYNKKNSIRILDMFSGSGCIGIAIMRHIENAQVVFADSQKNCIEQIKINLKINGLSHRLIRTNKPMIQKRYSVIKSDVFDGLNRKSKIVNLESTQFDYIFANPPYIPDYRSNSSARLRAILRNRVQKSVLKYEPKEALFGGKDGMDYIRKFLSEAKNFLKPGGKIYMEFDSPQKKKIEKLLKELGYESLQFHKDQYGKWRHVF